MRSIVYINRTYVIKQIYLTYCRRGAFIMTLLFHFFKKTQPSTLQNIILDIRTYTMQLDGYALNQWPQSNIVG